MQRLQNKSGCDERCGGSKVVVGNFWLSIPTLLLLIVVVMSSGSPGSMALVSFRNDFLLQNEFKLVSTERTNKDICTPVVISYTSLLIQYLYAS